MNSQIVLGLWPIAGITTVGVTETNARRTLAAAIDAGIEQFDTAFSYGYAGESDRLLGQAIGSRREQFQVIGKVGQRWTAEGHRINDGSPRTLTADAEESVRRIGCDYFDTLMLHSPGQQTPLEVSAEALVALQRRGLCRRIGVCNVSIEQYQTFAAVVDCAAVQCPLNLMQQQSLDELIPACQANRCEVYVFWTLMKGLLAGKIGRDHVFAADDVRPQYPIFQGQQRERTHRVLDRLQKLATALDKTIAQLTIGWVISQPGVTAALVGAHRPEQIQETAMTTPLDPETLLSIDQIVAEEVGV
jgi:aryl-alcohol dehydrogenase-like predicted oxidoreductase